MPPIRRQQEFPIITPVRSKEIVDQALEHEIESIFDGATLGPSYQQLGGVSHEVVMAGGKRLRPYMAMLAYEAYSHKSGESQLEAGVAIELLHTAMLMHDDVIDGDVIRHGAKNVIGHYMDIYEDHIPDEDARLEVAKSTAILAGDRILARAIQMFERLDLSPEVRRQVNVVFNDAMNAVTSGQLLDVQAAHAPISEVDPRRIAEQKTASYSFVAPLLIGAITGGAPEKEVKKLRAIATEAGIAFQLRDDFIGVFGDPEKSGKSASNDIREGKNTMITQLFYEKASEAEKQEYASIAGNHEATEGQLARAKSLLEKRTMAEVKRRLNSASIRLQKSIGKLAIYSDYHDKFKDLIVRSLDRAG